MIECVEKAKRECTSREDIKPDKDLRPIGSTTEEWIERSGSTEPDGWVTWRVIGDDEVYKGRRGNTLLYERCEVVELA